MNAQKFILATIFGVIVMFVLSFVWHGLLMANLYSAASETTVNIYRAEPQAPFIGLGYLVLTLIMAYIYPKGVEGVNKVTNGIRFGMLMGLIWVLPHSLVLYGVMEGFSAKMLVIDAVWHVVEQGLGGLTIALVYGNQIPSD